MHRAREWLCENERVKNVPVGRMFDIISARVCRSYIPTGRPANRVLALDTGVH